MSDVRYLLPNYSVKHILDGKEPRAKRRRREGVIGKFFKVR